MRRLFALLFSLFALSAVSGAAFAQAGYVHEMTGTVNARLGAAPARALAAGSLVNTGEIITTAAASTVVVKFEDGQVMTLAPNSSFAVREYTYNKQNISTSRAAFELLSGGLRFVSGVIGATNRNAFTLRAGTATIGIRGSDISAILQPGGALFMAVFAGAAAMTTPQGVANIIAGNTSSATPGQAPTPPAPSTAATAAVTQVLAVLATKVLPSALPVIVQASANAAAAQAQVAVIAAQAAANPTNTQLQAQLKAAQTQASQLLATAATATANAMAAATAVGAATPAPPAQAIQALPLLQQQINRLPPAEQQQLNQQQQQLLQQQQQVQQIQQLLAPVPPPLVLPTQDQIQQLLQPLVPPVPTSPN